MRFQTYILLLLACLSMDASAQGNLQQSIDAKRHTIKAIEQEIAQTEKGLASIKKEKAKKQEYVKQLASQIASRKQLIDHTEDQLRLLARQLAQSDSTATVLSDKLTCYREQYAAMVREAYRNYHQNSYISYLFSSKDFSEVARRIANIRGVAKMRETKMHDIMRLRTEVAQRQAELGLQKQSLDSTRRKLATQQKRFENDRSEAKKSLQQMTAKEKEALQNNEDLRRRLNAAVSELRKLTKGNKTGASFATHASHLNLPVVGGSVKRYRDNMAEIVGPLGASIIAIYEGKVVDVKRNRITGRYDVYIAHGEYITSYANLSNATVKKGDTVNKNSKIGIIGSAVDLQTLKAEYRMVFGIYPPAGGKAMRAADCFRK